MRKVVRLAGVLATLLATQGIASDLPPTRPTGVAPPKRIPSPTTASVAPAGDRVPISSVPLRVRRQVVADAARRFQVERNAVVLTHAERVTWADGSLGCPQPGHMYSQALVPGFRLLAKTAAGNLNYHADSRGNVVGCAQTQADTGSATQPPVAPR